MVGRLARIVLLTRIDLDENEYVSPRSIVKGIESVTKTYKA
jgi:hypothetical protein